MSSFDNEIQLSQYENLSKEKKIRKNKKKNNQYIIEMFRKGWICEDCNNLNYESRNKCYKYGIY